MIHNVIKELSTKVDRLEVMRSKCQSRCFVSDKAIKEIEKDTTIVGTAFFRTDWQARVYYSQCGFSSDDVNAKIAAGEISIGKPQGAVKCDSDGRYHCRLRSSCGLREIHDRQGNMLTRICGYLDKLSLELSILSKVPTSQPQDIPAPKTVTEAGVIARTIWRTEFTQDLPYCVHGQPFYTAERYEFEHNKPCNTSVYRIGEGTMVIARRVIGRPDSIHWGMRDGGKRVFVFHDLKLSCECLTVALLTQKIFDLQGDEK